MFEKFWLQTKIIVFLYGSRSGSLPPLAGVRSFMRREHRQEPQHPVPDLCSRGKVAPPPPAPGHVELVGSDVAPQYQEVAEAGEEGFIAAWARKKREDNEMTWFISDRKIISWTSCWLWHSNHYESRRYCKALDIYCCKTGTSAVVKLDFPSNPHLLQSYYRKYWL